MEREPKFAKELSERQVAVCMHYLRCLGLTPDDMQYIRTEIDDFDLYPVDLAIFKPSEFFDYWVIGTVGLSEYCFNGDNLSYCELMMVVPKQWQPILDKEEHYWVLDMLRDIAYGVIENKRGVAVNQLYLLADLAAGETFCKSTDAVGAIVTLPEMLSFNFLEEKIDGSYTRFLQLVPVTADNVSKIDEVGPAKFIEFDLHDSDGPKIVVTLKEKPLQGIDKLVKQNEDSLKGKKTTVKKGE